MDPTDEELRRNWENHGSHYRTRYMPAEPNGTAGGCG